MKCPICGIHTRPIRVELPDNNGVVLRCQHCDGSLPHVKPVAAPPELDAMTSLLNAFLGGRNVT